MESKHQPLCGGRWCRRADLALLLLLGSGAAFADGLRLSGFGTLGYAYDRRDDMAPARDISQQPRNGFATRPDWRLDSRFGVQMEYTLTRHMDLVGQVVVRDHFNADVESSTEQAYLAARPDGRWDLRFGRIGYDAFLMSDHRNVGYAYSWVRPPAEFYGWIPIFSLDGADAAYQLISGESHWRVKLQAGRSRFSIPIDRGYDFEAERLWGLSVAWQSGPWRLKAAHSRFTIGSEVPAFAPLHLGLAAAAAAGIPGASGEADDLRRNLRFEGARISYSTLGAVFDDGVWSAQAEVGQSTASAAVVPHSRMAYLSVGRRFGPLLPFVMWGLSRPGNDRRGAANDWGALNAALRDPALFVLNTTRIDQDTLSLGARWDFHRQAALKVQWDRTRVRPSGYGLWWRDFAINDEHSRVRLLSATLELVF